MVLPGGCERLGRVDKEAKTGGLGPSQSHLSEFVRPSGVAVSLLGSGLGAFCVWVCEVWAIQNLFWSSC